MDDGAGPLAPQKCLHRGRHLARVEAVQVQRIRRRGIEQRVTDLEARRGALAGHCAVSPDAAPATDSTFTKNAGATFNSAPLPRLAAVDCHCSVGWSRV